MSIPDHLALLISMLLSGSSAPLQPVSPSRDAGTIAASPDAGTRSTYPSAKAPDAGTIASKTGASASIPWPQEELTPLARLEGPAILAAHAALQEVMKRFPKENTKQCAFSPKSREFFIGYQAGWYFVRVNHRVDQCPGYGPGVTMEFDWFELYAYSPDGRLERYPYAP